MFESFNPYNNLDFMEADTPEELRDMIRQIPLPIGDVQFSFGNGKYIVWFRSDAKIVRTIRKRKKRRIDGTNIEQS